MDGRLRHLIPVVIVVTIGLLQAPALAGTPISGGTIRAALTASAPTLDPHSGTHLAIREVGLHIFESLLTFDAKFQIVPQLAERWEASPDGKVYTFTLRKGVKFHNGREMTAEDVRVSVERFRAVAPRRNELDGLAKL